VRLVAQFPLESANKEVDIKSKWNKILKGYFKQKKEYNMSGEKSRITRWNWYNVMDGMLSETTKTNSVFKANDHGVPVAGTEDAPMDVGDDDGCGTTPAAAIHAADLPGIHGVLTKCRKINGDIASRLDCFAESSTCIEWMKMETLIQLHVDNKKLEMDIFQSQQATIEGMATLFANMICNVNRGERSSKDNVKE
jgi:hypothetical protein